MVEVAGPSAKTEKTKIFFLSLLFKPSLQKLVVLITIIIFFCFNFLQVASRQNGQQEAQNHLLP